MEYFKRAPCYVYLMDLIFIVRMFHVHRECMTAKIVFVMSHSSYQKYMEVRGIRGQVGEWDV